MSRTKIFENFLSRVISVILDISMVTGCFPQVVS